jgi:hypothetical protein
MKIQIVKKGTARGGADAICPWIVDVPVPDSKKN